MVVTSLYHYPLKGFSAQPLQYASLTVGKGFPNDRLWGFAKPSSKFDPLVPELTPEISATLHKTSFYSLLQHERLAEVRSHYDLDSQTLTLDHRGVVLCREILTTRQAAQRVGDAVRDFLGLANDEQPILAYAGKHQFTDTGASTLSMRGAWKKDAISLINLDSLSALEGAIGKSLNPLRFRGNVYFRGVPAFAEHDWVGQKITLGGARLRVLEPTVRCKATEVDPDSGVRDMPIVKLLKQHFGHANMGIYAAVVEAGELAIGDLVQGFGD